MRMISTLLPALSIGAMLAVTPALADGDAAAGKKTFKRCLACHTVDAGKKKATGPNLLGIVGREAAKAEFKYSKAMRAKAAEGLIWTEANLDAWLSNPKEFVRKTKMFFPGLTKTEQRADVIAYLKSLK